MARRARSEAEQVALDRLKDRRDRESNGYAEFFEAEQRRRQLCDELASLDVEQAEALAKIATVSDVAAIADVIEWSPARVRSAVKLAGDEESSVDVESGVHTAADVAV